MTDETDFLELLKLQDSLDLVTKSEVIEWAKKHHLTLTNRRLTSLIAEGLLPKTARIGSRGGAFPKMVQEQLRFVIRWRDRGLSVSALRELLPVWRYMVRAVRQHEVDIALLESVAVDSVETEEALYALPAVILQTLPCPNCEGESLSEIKFRMKDGVVMSRGADDNISIGFVNIGIKGDFHPFARVSIPHANEINDPSSIVLTLAPKKDGVPTPQDMISLNKKSADLPGRVLHREHENLL